MDIKRHLEIVKKAPSGKGKTSYIKYLSGIKLSATPSIESKCYDCQGYYVDGRTDCKMPDCPLYPWMPYKGQEELP